jgi:hypothetical protein
MALRQQRLERMKESESLIGANWTRLNSGAPFSTRRISISPSAVPRDSWRSFPPLSTSWLSARERNPTPAPMGQIELNGAVWRGTQCGALGLGVYTPPWSEGKDDKKRECNTYAGGHADGKADGYAVIKHSSGTHSGQFVAGAHHGYAEYHHSCGAVHYYLHEHGTEVRSAYVSADGQYCSYDRQACGAAHAEFVALKKAAQHAGVRPPTHRTHDRTRAKAHARACMPCMRACTCWYALCTARVCACVMHVLCARARLRVLSSTCVRFPRQAHARCVAAEAEAEAEV